MKFKKIQAKPEDLSVWTKSERELQMEQRGYKLYCNMRFGSKSYPRVMGAIEFYKSLHPIQGIFVGPFSKNVMLTSNEAYDSEGNLLENASGSIYVKVPRKFITPDKIVLRNNKTLEDSSYIQ
jgi:hypothetical protein